MENIEINDVAEKVVEKLLPAIKELLRKAEHDDDELTISDLKEQYPGASLYLVRKWCKNGTLDHWTSGDSSNSRYIFRRDDFESVYYNKFKKE